MKSKFEMSEDFLKNDDILKCPICGERLLFLDNCLKCGKHSFDISRKGTVNLVYSKHYKNSKIYNSELFKNRREFIIGGFYFKLYKFISDILNDRFSSEGTILDLGCGEGSHSKFILDLLKFDYKYYGFDYAKDAIKLASDYINYNRFYFLGDVNKIPILENSIDIILDMLSPFNEKEVKRIIKDSGVFIKVSPGKNYLKELRDVLNMEEYNNENDVFDNLQKRFKKIDKYNLNYRVQINEDSFQNLVKMTPAQKKTSSTISFVTIDLNVYVIGI